MNVSNYIEVHARQLTYTERTWRTWWRPTLTSTGTSTVTELSETEGTIPSKYTFFQKISFLNPLEKIKKCIFEIIFSKNLIILEKDFLCF